MTMPSKDHRPFQHADGVARYVGKNGVAVPIFLTVVTVALGVFLWAFRSRAFSSLIDWIGIVAGIVTLAVVWFLDRRREWIDSVEKRASITYWFWTGDGWKRWKSIHDVFLAGESDIRQWSQSLGGQLKRGDIYLPLDAYVHVTDRNPPPVETSNSWVRRYEVHMPLWMDPDEYDRSIPFRSALYKETPQESGDWKRIDERFELLLSAIEESAGRRDQKDASTASP